MADIDKILEAEKTITTISGELSKMKSAVELLDSTKTKAEAVIRTGETVVENINSFVKQGSALVEKIGDFDIQAEIEKVNKQLTSVKKDLSNKTKIMGKNIDGVNEGLEKLEKRIIELFKQNDEKVEQNQIYLYMAIGLNILITGFIAFNVFDSIN
mgnify:CR=1 FL=1